MTSPASGAPRALRAGAFTLAAVSLALAAHTFAGGARPGALPLLAAVVALGCCCMLATRRRIGRTATVTGLIAAQLSMHLWFSLTAGHACSVGGLALGGFGGHVHGGHGLGGTGLGGSAFGGADACPPVGAESVAAAPSAVSATLMLAGHLVAVVLTAVLLAHGESLLWRLAATARTALCRLPDVQPIETAPRAHGHLAAPLVLTIGSRAQPRRRGPPAWMPAT